MFIPAPELRMEFRIEFEPEERMNKFAFLDFLSGFVLIYLYNGLC